MTIKRRKDGKETRTQILEAAGALIAEKGFAHTTNKSIAAKAGVDLASINYHFGGREGLYQAVLVEGHKSFIDIDELAQLAESILEPREKLGQFLKRLIENLLSIQGWQSRIFLQEFLSPSNRTAESIQKIVMPKASYLIKILHQITGIPETDPAMKHCLISIMAPGVILLFTGDGGISPIRLQKDQESRRRFIEHHIKFSLAGLDAVRDEYHRNRSMEK